MPSIRPALNIGLGALLLLLPSPAEAQGRRSRWRADRAPKVGTLAPDFELTRLEEGKPAAKKKAKVKLSSFRTKRPVALVFGSYT